MTNEILYTLAKQLPTATGIRTNYGEIELDDEMRRAVETALIPILEKRVGIVREKQVSSLQKFAKDIQRCMDPISMECLCTDEKEDNSAPHEHADYCPVYLWDYLGRVAAKEE